MLGIEGKMLRTSIRRCRKDDAQALSLIGQATFLETFAGILDGSSILAHCERTHSVQSYASVLETKGYAVWLAEVAPGSSPVGLLMVAPPNLPLDDTSEDLELKRIYLLSKFQGGGNGKQMMNTAVEHAANAGARRLLLGVYAKNHKAIRFYEHMGFEVVGTRQFNVGGRDYDDRILSKRINT